ncbi:MAG: cobalamin biosynthesis protein CobG [Rhodobacteraceae bacterium]|nr:cobalamin biosynthesis protein CobG [Paracoccaceae bacterium]
MNDPIIKGPIIKGPIIKGWCPGAYRPMMSGDGLVVRIRPYQAHFSRAQILGLCQAAIRHGSGMIDLTNRANLQIRGVKPDAHAPLLDDLRRLNLLDPDPANEARRNILLTPFYQAGDLGDRLSRALVNRLAELPDLPAKFGFVIDTGATRVLGDCSGDIRLESGADGGLTLRADGAETGRNVSESSAVDHLIELARWFAKTAGGERRMARLSAVPRRWRGAAPAAQTSAPLPGRGPCGALFGVPFGQIDAASLIGLINQSDTRALRVTPWRMVLMDGDGPSQSQGFITGPDDPLSGVDACPGAPYCPQATVETRAFARRLAHQVAGTLHVSGCAKGCARATPADITLVGHKARFDLVTHGRAGDEPAQQGLTPATLLAMKF